MHLKDQREHAKQRKCHGFINILKDFCLKKGIKWGCHDILIIFMILHQLKHHNPKVYLILSGAESWLLLTKVAVF